MTRRFFDQVDDELRGLLGPALRDYRRLRTGRLLKLWYEDPAVHFEAQRISQRWAPESRPAVEVGLHLEAPSAERNEAILERLTGRPGAWRRKLPRAEAGNAFGPQSAAWRRLSEVIDGGDGDDPDLASEVAERLAAYVRTLGPLLAERSVARGRRGRRLPASTVADRA